VRIIFPLSYTSIASRGKNYGMDSNQNLPDDKDLGVLSVGIPKYAPQIQDGGRPPS